MLGRMEKKIKYAGVIDKEGFTSANRVIIGGGISPTILARDHKDPTKVLKKWKRK